LDQVVLPKLIVNANARKLKNGSSDPITDLGAAYVTTRMPWHLFGGTHAAVDTLATARSAACHLRRDVRLTDV